MNNKMKKSLKNVTMMLVAMYITIGTMYAQEAEVYDEAATISRLVDRIDQLEEEKKALKAIDRRTLSEREEEVLKSELRAVRKELTQERNKLEAIQDLNDPYRNRVGYYGAFGPAYGFGYNRFLHRRAFVRPVYRYRRVCH